MQYINRRFLGTVLTSSPAKITEITETRAIGEWLNTPFNVKHNGKCFRVGSKSSVNVFRFADSYTK